MPSGKGGIHPISTSFGNNWPLPLAYYSDASSNMRSGRRSGIFAAVALGNESITRKLIALLPTRATRPVRLQAGLSQSTARMESVVSIVAIAVVLMMLARLLIPGADGLAD